MVEESILQIKILSMRRNEQYILNGALIGGAIVSFADIFLQWLEHRNDNQEFTWESYDGWRTLKRGAIGSVVGGGIGYVAYQYKLSEEAKLPFSSDNYLKKLLNEENLKADSNLYDKVISTKNDLKQWLFETFKSELITFPEDTGSFFKKTAIKSKFDLDMILPFKKSSYKSLEEMYYAVLNVVGNKFETIAKVTKQTKSVGLTICIEERDIHFDIVPGREINNYKTDRDLNLYVRPNWPWQNRRHFKTNTGIQRRITVNNPKARSVVKLLKKYRNGNYLDLPSPIIERYTVDALSDKNYGLHSSETNNLLNCMEHISKKLTQQSLIDRANSNNNLHSKINYFERESIATQLKKDILNIENNERYIKEIFGIELSSTLAI